MAKFQVVLSEQEVRDILIETVRKKFSLSSRTTLDLIWTDDSGIRIETPDEPINKTSWLEEF